MNDVDLAQLETTLLNALGILFDAMLDAETVPVAFLTVSLETVRNSMIAKGLRQSAGHMEVLRDFVAERSAERARTHMLLEAPKGTA